jgi:hypothetical protein
MSTRQTALIGLTSILTGITAGLYGQTGYDPFDHSAYAMTTLLAWGTGSIGAGAGMQFNENETIKSIGIQNIAWGAIDAGIAVWALQSDRHQRGSVSADKRRLSLRTTLIINGLLDIAYIGAGALLYRFGKSKKLQGTGIGFMVQGGFLFAFDWVNAGLTYRR